MSSGPTHTWSLNEGWAVGLLIGSTKYLTVPSSYWSSRLIFPSAEEAEPRAKWLRANHAEPEKLIVRRVRRIGETEFLLLDNEE